MGRKQNWNDLLNVLGIWIVLLRILSTTHIPSHGDTNGTKERKQDCTLAIIVQA
jgi:hypothetical protein